MYRNPKQFDSDCRVATFSLGTSVLQIRGETINEYINQCSTQIYSFGR